MGKDFLLLYLSLLLVAVMLRTRYAEWGYQPVSPTIRVFLGEGQNNDCVDDERV